MLVLALMIVVVRHVHTSQALQMEVTDLRAEVADLQGVTRRAPTLGQWVHGWVADPW